MKRALSSIFSFAFAINAIATLQSAKAQMPDVDAAILRAKESGSSMDFRRVEEALGKLEQSKQGNQREETDQIQSAEASRLFLNELATAKQLGINERFVVKIDELTHKYPDALSDATIRNLVNVARTETQNFFRATFEEQRKKRVQSDLRLIAGQLRIYQSDNGSLPTQEQGIAALVTTPTTDPKPNKWRQLLQRVPLDPWGEPYVFWRDGDEFRIASKGLDRQEGNEDDFVFNSSSEE